MSVAAFVSFPTRFVAEDWNDEPHLASCLRATPRARVGGVRVARRSLVVVLTTVVVGCCWMPAARAVLDARDPDDVGSTFDIRRVESGFAAIPGGTYVQLKVRFFEAAEWTRRTTVHVSFDSRSGPGFDYLLTVGMERGSIRARLSSRVDPSEVMRVRKLVWDRRVFLSLPTDLLRPTREIAWKVRTLVFRRTGTVIDRAPDTWSEWYPHI